MEMNTSRLQYYEHLQNRLQFSAALGYSSLEKTVLDEITTGNHQYYELPNVCQIHSFSIDSISKNLYPTEDELCKGYLPVKVYGDGNCQFRAASLYVFGSEANHMEIRCRVIFEMVKQKNWYISDKSFLQYAQFSDVYNPSDNLRHVKGFEEVYKKSVLNFAKRNTWGDMWTLIALSSVLGCTIYSIYPNLIGTQRDRNLMHRKIQPRSLRSSDIVRIMWTNMHMNSGNDRWWQPNHFVACAAEVESEQQNTVPFCKKRPNPTLGDYFFFMKAKCPKRTEKNTQGNNNKQPNQKLIQETDSADQNNKFKSEKTENNTGDKKLGQKEDALPEKNEKIPEPSKQKYEKESYSADQDDMMTENTENYTGEETFGQKEDALPKTENNDDEQSDTSSQSNNINALPYNVSNDFYYRMGRSAALNNSRDQNRGVFLVMKDANNQNTNVRRTEVKDKTIASQLTALKKQSLWEIKKSKRAHLTGIIECGSYIVENGPLVKTQVLCTILQRAKINYKGIDIDNTKRKLSIELLETLSKYLPVMQIYIGRTGYIMEYREGDVQGFIDTVSNAVDQQELANRNLESTLENFKDYLKFTDTQLDKSIIRSILVELYSIKSVSRLEGSKCKETLRRAAAEIPRKMESFRNLKRNLLSVRNDMTNHQQFTLFSRRASKLKAQAFKTRAKGAGRPKISDVFPQLAEVLELAFGDGSKIHPRLQNDTRYKNPSLALTMPQAREILLTASSDKIPNIALSTCYTYTQNFRKNTLQAKRHHLGQDVNAKISLKKLPRVGMMEERVNAHYCRSNVNFHLEKAASDEADTLVDAKDAKGIVCADIDPVQNIGKSWLDTTRQDHQFDQSRTNACTPMTHLFLQTVSSDTVIRSSNLTAMNVVRTGQPVTLVNISYFEPETVFRCFNELFHLLSLPALDVFFRNKETGKIRKKWIFVVDNGPSEAPASNLVRMLLVRLVNFLDLDKATQISFEKLNSKDNPAERPHASENLVLSKHGPFKSTEIFPHKGAKPGTEKHFENMEAMAEKVISCLRTAKFGQNQFFCFRGVRDDFIFNDETDLRNFIKLSEHGKNECIKQYKVLDCSLTNELHNVWGSPKDFTGSYLDDYNHLCNSIIDDMRTAWLTEYCATIFTKTPKDIERFVREPIPDFIRWLESNGELHYMCHEARQALTYGDWDLEEFFLPSRIISLFSELNTDIPNSVKDSAALLAWVTPDQLKDNIKTLNDKMEHTLDMEKCREKWKNHDLFKKTVSDLQLEAKNMSIPYTPKHTKTDLIEIIAEKKNLPLPNDIDLYNGILQDVPIDICSLTNMNAYELRQILKYHNVNYSGSKDELVMKVFLLRHKRSYMILNSIIGKLSKIAETAISIIIWQKRHYNEINHIYRQRKFSASKNCSTIIQVPEHISDDRLTELFDPLLEWLDNILTSQYNIDKERELQIQHSKNVTADPYEQCKETGAKIKVYWNREEIGTFQWNIGWYTANVLSYDEDFDSLEIEYSREPGAIYTMDFTPNFLNGKLKFVASPFYS